MIIAGVDEAGRGALAGPVVAAACVLPEGYALDGLTDSKKVPPTRRETLFESLTRHPEILYAVGIVSAARIDQINILQATFEAMKKAIDAIPGVNQALIDGNLVPPNLRVPAEAIVKGDQTIASISAASILAKVTRDRLMCELSRQYPDYGFEKHKGYGTLMHRTAIQQIGPLATHHRQTFIGRCCQRIVG